MKSDKTPIYAAGARNPSRAWANNNPGNLRPRISTPPWPGQHQIDNDHPDPPYAMFTTRSEGWCALQLWIMYAYDVRGLKTVTDMIHVFAPWGDNNNPSAEAKDIVSKLGDKIDPHVASQREALAKLIAHWEDYRPQWPQVEIDAGGKLCDLRYPAFLQAIQDTSSDILNQQELDNLKDC